MSIAKELSDFRQGKGITLRRAEELSGIPYARICKIENEKAPLDYEDLVRLCQAYGVPAKQEASWAKGLRRKIILAG